jgi:hypothetical protein
VRGDDPGVASYLRIEERELEAVALNRATGERVDKTWHHESLEAGLIASVPVNPDDVAPIWLQAVALTVALTPTVALIVFRRSIGVMNAAAGLVIWGALTACSGWFAVLVALLAGGSLELVLNGPTGYPYQHIGLYGYPLAWAAALVIALRSVASR